ncbi:lactonase family protein [Sphingomonas sp. CARO-RG-8B-R24-01]|uniref:lactonase family protein n=1 Tax=Sphingomonas sp. CARO-RG-8B-R24-01 TaxID=2914831 RepID=UPI001F5AEC45|nr:lactonase family protein [Sphingomonas sp. CARO-RG-8B-R24-01]
MTEPQPVLHLAAGTYRGGGGRGLQSVALFADGRLVPGAAFDQAPNSAFSIYSHRHDLHYVVDEDAIGRVGVLRHGAQGWARLASLEIGGAAPCHIALDRTETRLAVANYASGSMSLVRLDPQTGLPAGDVQVRANAGSGPDPHRQEAPHAHWVGFSPDGRRLYQTDLGTDEVLRFAIDGDGAVGVPRTAYAAPPGSGPRHLLLHPHLPRRAYLANELANTLTVLECADDGTLAAVATLSTLPPGWQGESILAHIALNAAGDRLYVSNRGHDSVAVFALDRDGMPTLLDHAPTNGASPRFFLLLEDHRLLVVAHEKAQTVTTLAIDADGRLGSTGTSLPIPGVGYVLRV